MSGGFGGWISPDFSRIVTTAIACCFCPRESVTSTV